jgi:hypothetical protein
VQAKEAGHPNSDLINKAKEGYESRKSEIDEMTAGYEAPTRVPFVSKVRTLTASSRTASASF